MIFQMNENHGRHIAYSPTEAEYNEKHGWKTVTEEEFYAGIYKKSEDATPKDELVNAYIEKFGKKPHHKMKPETILEKINANGS